MGRRHYRGLSSMISFALFSVAEQAKIFTLAERLGFKITLYNHVDIGPLN